MKHVMLYMSGLVSILFILNTGAPVRAGSLTPGNILVSTDTDGGPSLSNSVFEYTTSGTLVQQFQVPAGPADENLRGIAVNSAGQVQIFNGTFTPELTTLTPTPGGGPGVGTYANTTLSGWSMANVAGYGEIGAVGNYVFAGDMATANAGSPNGIIRFDTLTNTAVRFMSGTDYSSVTVGANGLVYAINLSGSQSEVNVFNPNTMSKVQTILFSGQAEQLDLRGIAVDAKGNIFGAGWDGNIYELNSSGVVVNTLNSGYQNLTSIALDSQGDLVVGDSGGRVILTTTALTSETSFVVSNQFLPIHVAFTSPLTIASVPEPSSVVLAGIASVLGLGFWAHRRRQAKG